MMDLFPFIEALFNKIEYAKIPDSIKRKHFFMTQRFMSIKYPVEANNFNIIGINQVIAIDFWHMILCRTYGRKPQWLYTKTNKAKDSAKKDKIDKLDSKLISFYIKKKKMIRKDFDFLREIMPDELYDELKRLKTVLKENSVKI